MAQQPEVWMRGPVEGIDPWLQPVAHSFLQVKEDLEGLRASVTESDLWIRPGGAASIGFHIEHIGGSTDRLFTYARGESLTPDQLAALKAEGTRHDRPFEDVITATVAAVDRALMQVRTTPISDLATVRKLGRAALPTTTLGLLFHAAEHATRHIGQAITTARVLRQAPQA